MNYTLNEIIKFLIRRKSHDYSWISIYFFLGFLQKK